jgi:hypothetical protein
MHFYYAFMFLNILTMIQAILPRGKKKKRRQRMRKTLFALAVIGGFALATGTPASAMDTSMLGGIGDVAKSTGTVQVHWRHHHHHYWGWRHHYYYGYRRCWWRHGYRYCSW